MGRICPILNHPLRDGVLVEDVALVNFIQKRNLDFLPNELVCRSCKREVTKLFNKKIKRAIELHKSHMHEHSISSLRTSKSSSSASTTSELSRLSNRSLQPMQVQINQHTSIQWNERSKSKSITNKSSPIKVINIPPANIVSENRDNQAVNNETNTREEQSPSNVTIRKKTIRDYLTTGVPPKTDVILKTPQVPAGGDDVVRRLSQEPTTSNALHSRKRIRFRNISTDDDDDEHLSLNAINGTSLPHIQPIPPKRKPSVDRQNTLARDIMNEYIKDITGG